MPWIITTKKAGATFGNTGKFFFTNPAGSETPEIPLPTGVNAVDGRPCSATFNFDAKSRQYYTGGWTDNLVFTENFDLMRQGILPPPNPIVNAGGAGSAIGVVVAAGPGRTGNAVCYVRWRDQRNQRFSPLSGPSPTIAMANQALSWTNLPTQPNDPSVTHIDLFVAMNGGSPRLAVTRDLGTTAVTENIATGSLGIAVTEAVERFSRGRFNVVWHDRQFVAGDDRHPERLYASPIEQPEDKSFFLRTRKGEKITALIALRDQLVVLTPVSSYIVQGYTEDDIKMDILEPEIGCLGHHLIALADGFAFVPSLRGIYLCTGTGMHPISLDFQHTWSNNLPGADAWAVNDVNARTYKLFMDKDHTSFNFPEMAAAVAGLSWFSDTVRSVYLNLDYTGILQETGGGFSQPALSWDMRARRDECAAILRNPGDGIGTLYTGSCDGTVRKDDKTNSDDDDDTFKKTFICQTGHYFFDEPGGTPLDGWNFPRAWMHVEAEANAWSDYVYAGDEYAWTQLSPYLHEEAASRETIVIDGTIYYLEPKCVANWEPAISGRGISHKFVCRAPYSHAVEIDLGATDGLIRELRWSGFGGTRKRGENDRAPRNLRVDGGT